MGNLPIRSETHIQEEKSRKAFRAILPERLFIIRDQFENDYGTDIIIELVTLAGYVTNYQCQIQLKSKKSGKTSKDNSLNYPVPVKTINYLINQPNSLFVIYLENANTFYWEWADIINHYFLISGEDLNTTGKRYVSYNFKRVLDEDSFKAIYKRILDRSVMIKDLVSIVNSKNNGAIQVSIDGLEEKIIDYANIENQIIKYGIALCNKHEYEILSNWIQQLPISAKKNDKLALVVSYYMTHIGNFLNALYWLPQINKGSDLDNDERYLAEYLSLKNKNILGLISPGEYMSNIKILADKEPENLLSLQALIEYHKLSIAMNKINDETITKFFFAVVNAIKSISNISQLIIDDVELDEFEVEGILIFQEIARTNFKLIAHKKLDYFLPRGEVDEIYKNTQTRLKKWVTKYNEIISSVSVAPIIKSKYILSYSSTYLVLIETPKIMESDNELTEADKNDLSGLAENLEWAFHTFDKAGLMHESLAIKWQMANLYKKLNNIESFNDNIHFVIDRANEIGYTSMAKNAEDYLEDSEASGGYQSLSDEDLKIYAQQYLEAFNLPQDRFDNVYKDYFWSEKDRQERINWCSYIETKQDLRHTLIKSTKYAFDPSRMITCSKFNYKSPKMGYERDILIAQFKAKYCADCKERNPKK